MSIDKSGQWWIGNAPEDTRGFLEAYASDSYHVHDFRLAKCDCGCIEFQLDADDQEGCAKRTCVKCQREHFICDSKEFWEEASPQHWACIECDSERTNVGVGFSFYPDSRDVKWLYVGCRCAKCGVLGCFAGWKVGYGDSERLLDEE